MNYTLISIFLTLSFAEKSAKFLASVWSGKFLGNLSQFHQVIHMLTILCKGMESQGMNEAIIVNNNKKCTTMTAKYIRMNRAQDGLKILYEIG